MLPAYRIIDLELLQAPVVKVDYSWLLKQVGGIEAIFEKADHPPAHAPILLPVEQVDPKSGSFNLFFPLGTSSLSNVSMNSLTLPRKMPASWAEPAQSPGNASVLSHWCTHTHAFSVFSKGSCQTNTTLESQEKHMLGTLRWVCGIVNLCLAKRWKKDGCSYSRAGPTICLGFGHWPFCDVRTNRNCHRWAKAWPKPQKNQFAKRAKKTTAFAWFASSGAKLNCSTWDPKIIQNLQEKDRKGSKSMVSPWEIDGFQGLSTGAKAKGCHGLRTGLPSVAPRTATWRSKPQEIVAFKAVKHQIAGS